jgi:hypothetical protein
MKNIRLILFGLVSLMLSCYVGAVAAAAYQEPALFLPVAAIVLSGSFISVKNAQGSLMFALNAKNILYPQGRLNPGGIAGFIYYAFEEDIEDYPAALSPDTETALTFDALGSVPIADPFVMKTGKFFHKIYCTLEMGEVKFSMVGVRDSKSFENSVEISFPGNEAEMIGFIAAAANRRLAVIVPEQNNKLRVIGHPNFPAQLDTSEGTSGKAVADGRATVITIKASAGTPAPIYLAPVPLEPVV